MPRTEESKKPLTKTEILNAIAQETELSRKQVSAVLEALAGQIKKSLGNRGPGVFAIPGLVKIEKKKVPARPARKGVPNPFKPGETMDIPAKPATTKIKVRALKNLKSMV
jgi:nucleoid DNA-binding protein